MSLASLRDGLVLAICPSINGGGGTVPDLSGRNNHGVLTNMDATDYVSYHRGIALDFDGKNDYLVLNGSIGSELGRLVGDKTLSCWIRTSSPGTGYRTVFSRDKAFAITVKDSVFITYDWFTSSDQSSGVNIADGTWKNLVVRISAGVANGSQLFINGQQAGASFTYNTQIASGSALYASIGSAFNSANVIQPEYINAQLDDIRAYNRTVSLPEIQLLATEPGIELRPERTSVFFGADLFSAAWLSRQSTIIGGGVA